MLAVCFDRQVNVRGVSDRKLFFPLFQSVHNGLAVGIIPACVCVSQANTMAKASQQSHTRVCMCDSPLCMHTRTLSHMEKSKHAVKKGVCNLPLHMQNCHVGIVGACQGSGMDMPVHTRARAPGFSGAGGSRDNHWFVYAVIHTLFACICGRNTA